MIVRMTILQILLSAVGLVLGGLALVLTYLRLRHLRALRRARALADRIRQPAGSLAEVEAQSAALEELAQLSDTKAAVTAARELLPEFDATVRSAALEVLRKTRAFDRWTRDLQRGRPAARLRAITALGEVGDERAIDALIGVLADGDAGVVQAAIHALLLRDRDYAIDRLADSLGCPNRGIAARAAAVLIGLGAEAVEPLMGQLVEVNRDARQLAAETLATIGDDRAVPALLPLLETEPDAHLRLAILQAVVSLDPQMSPPAVHELALSDPDAPVRARAFAVLAQLNPPGAAEFLLAQLAEHSLPSLGAGEHGEGQPPSAVGDTVVLEAITAGLRTLGVEEAEIARVQREAADLTVEGLNGRVVASPLASLTARDPVTRAEAVREVGGLGASAAVYLRPALRDPDPIVRADAARALGRIGTIGCLQHLSACLQDPVQEVRLAAVAAVRAIVTRDAARELQR